MKKVFAPLLALALVTSAFAATDSTTSTTTAETVDLISVPATSTFTLAVPAAGATATVYDSPAKQEGVLDISHNRGGALTKKVTLSVTADAGNAVGHDITLKVGQAATNATAASKYVTVVNAGALQTDNTAGALELITGVADGSSSYDLWWDADATIAGTQAGSYGFTVTFTTVDE